MTCGNDEDATLILIQIPLVSTRQQAQLRKLAVPMHLTIDQCADSVIACTRSWLLKTKTSFFGYENWSLPWYFGLLCFSYTLSGIVLLLTKRPNRQDLFPRNLYALLLIFIQGAENTYYGKLTSCSSLHFSTSPALFCGRLLKYGSR